MAAAITEGVGYVVLLIPRRIKQIKDEGREEWLAKGREEGIAKGREEGFQDAIRAGLATRKPQAGDENIDGLQSIIALYNSGDITVDELSSILSRRYNGGGESD